ncbi:tryptophan 2,3-dioxygenase family protein [Thalassotalea ponticola]|uniref:tryptophan 2,3-dioxygenase n=1 Tax=Thalassotalea ponticola TaxID=1523392 RepID=UPI0025B5618E|nr:tryptophan 2,3-dioxygenase family protein [Thalassotalea ponticola]MDN3653332.1 tryptophan 2,3-dioxygenase family protein [Thalassotalea ponticola]
MPCPYHNNNKRDLEEGIHSDFSTDMSYADYLCLEQVLNAQKPLTNEHDEMLFITIHQASELWIKLAGYEISSAINSLNNGDFGQAFKVIARVKQIFVQLTQSWGVLSTLTPVDYLKFRDALGRSSGFQSYGYRKLEFLLGNKNIDMLKVHKSNEQAYQELSQICAEPSLYDHAIKALATAGFNIDQQCLERDFNQPYKANESVLEAWLGVYHHSEEYFELYELAEKLMDIEDAFQNWRFKHMYTVQRIIGNKQGTGGSSGVGFLKKALDISFFPELLELRTRL